MSTASLIAYVERVKASWRETERHKTWEEKISAIERMREREQQLKRARKKVAMLMPFSSQLD
jgi:hypothetical protein